MMKLLPRRYRASARAWAKTWTVYTAVAMVGAQSMFSTAYGQLPYPPPGGQPPGAGGMQSLPFPPGSPPAGMQFPSGTPYAPGMTAPTMPTPFQLPTPSTLPAPATVAPAAPSTNSNTPTRDPLPPTIDEASPDIQARVDTFIADIQGPEVTLKVKTSKSKLVRTRVPLVRVAIADPGVVDIVNFSPNEFELIGRNPGETTMTLWFAGAQPGGFAPNLRYLIKVDRDLQSEERANVEYGMLEKRINEMFPNSYIQLIPVADKLIVRGQARDAEESSQIMSVLRGGTVDQGGNMLGPGSWAGFGGGFGGVGVNAGVAARIPGATDLPAAAVINLLRVPGEQQVMLKVRIAELKRSAMRQIGADFVAIAGDFTFSSLFDLAGAYQVVLDSAQVQLALSALSSNNTSKILAEPNLVTLSGYPASFMAGGQFAVPTVVGVGGVQAATTQFHGFGTQIQFTPTVLDKDHIRLQVTPTFSTINRGLSVQGIFGMDTRTVMTTVDLREGQWLAVAGLLQDQQVGEKVRVPWLGDLPVIGTLFGRNNATRDETELVVLVSPELVHPLEPDQMPLILPGMEVTEPDDLQFFIEGRYEGAPDHYHRSTIWPVYMYQWQDAKLRAYRDAKLNSRYGKSERFYMNGPMGFSGPAATPY